MRAKIGGVALAAVVSACALACSTGKAAAYNIYEFRADTLNGADGGYQLEFYTDTVSRGSYLHVSESYELPSGDYLTEYYDAVGAILNGFSFKNIGNQTYRATFDFLSYDAEFATGINYQYDTVEKKRFRYDISFLISGSQAFDVKAADLMNCPSCDLEMITVDTFSADPAPSFVPLPSTAPLFGAGLLALTAVGWSARRRKAQCATAPTG